MKKVIINAVILVSFFHSLILTPAYSSEDNLNKTLKSQPAYTNSLIEESSPYLLQHAHNPVNWYAWNKKAFQQAKKLNRPIFLSIGYSTCHWCHVMENESFENVETAKILNQHFVSIKVDREQRPDIDALYMNSVVLLNGQGGWPLNVFITPDGDFFYGASYFPPDKFKQVLLKVSSLWEKDQSRVIKMAKSTTQLVKQQQSQLSSTLTSKKINHQDIEKVTEYFLKRFDSLQGGFSQAPKFPNESILFFLIDSLSRKENVEIFNAVESTLNAMSNGGIYDHIGGGFHRYSIDNSWFTPHFEKMLYNQAHLASIYMSFYKLSGNIEFAEIARQIIDYALKDMRSDEELNGFYSASDADSRSSINAEAEEGVYYLWKYRDLKSALTKDEFQLLIDVYGVNQKGNFPEAGEGENILFRFETLGDYANKEKLDLVVVINKINELRKKLYKIRNKRIAPLIDKKVLTSWNAMMISTLVQASTSFKNKNYLQEALKTVNFLNKFNINYDTKQLLRSSINEKANILASQEDYAYFIKALIDLYDQTNNDVWLNQAEQLMKQMIALFWDNSRGGFYQDNPLQDVPLSTRLKDTSDAAIPSGNSISLDILTKLISRSTNQLNIIKYQQLFNQMMAYYGTRVDQIVSMPYMLMVIQKQLKGDSSSVQYGAKGNIKASIKRLVNSGTYQLDISLKKGWHINSDSPIQKNLIKTSITLASPKEKIALNSKISIENINYPKAHIKKLGFSRTKLSLYENDLNITFQIKKNKLNTKQANRLIVPVKFDFQACSEKVCLAPEMLMFYLPVAK
jgi:uncharacterized protein